MVPINPDVLDHILEHMVNEKVALAALCRVNKMFKEAAEPVLYQSIVMPLPAVSRPCITLAASERLALHVRHFEIDRRLGWKPRDATELLILRSALLKMKRLRILRIHFGGPLGWILQDCSFGELRSLLCNLSCDHHLANFFKRQPQLTDVTLRSLHLDHFPCFIDPSCMPNLQQVSADPIWLGMLLPGHSIVNVDVWHFMDGSLPTITSWDIGWLSLSLTPVVSLSIPESLLVSQGSTYVASLVPHLRRLKVRCGTRDIFSNEVETGKRYDFTAWLSRTLGFFSSLEAFEVHFRENFVQIRSEDPRLRQFVMDASEHSHGLREFITTFALSMNSSIMTVVWRRDGDIWSKDL